MWNYCSSDPGYPFTEVLLYGHEWSLLSLEMLLFSVVDLASHNFVLAAVITFVITQVMVAARSSSLSHLCPSPCPLSLSGPFT